MSDSETKTITIPAVNEYGELNVLVKAKERKEQQTTFYSTIGGVRSPMITVDANSYDPYKELRRIICGKYKLSLVQGYLTTDKPLLIIEEL